MKCRINNPVLGVPITFLDKYNPEQFEIIDLTVGGVHDVVKELKKYNSYKEIDGKTNIETGCTGGKANGSAVLKGKILGKNYFIDNAGDIVHQLYSRIFIKRKDV